MSAKGTIIPYAGARGLVYRMKFRDASGRQVQMTIGAAADGWTRAKAEAVLADKMAEVRRGFRQPTRTRFADFAPKAVTGHVERKMLKETTKETYYGDLRRHLLPFFGNYTLSEIEAFPEIIDDYVTAKVREGCDLA